MAATDKQKRAIEIYVANRGKSKAQAMRDAGYADATARNPKNLTNSSTWDELMEKALPDKKLLQVHKQILNAQKLEHMAYPLGMEEADIKKLLNSVGCKPKKIQYGQTAIHVWYWAPDRKAQAAAVDMAYKLKGKITKKVSHELSPDNPYRELDEDELRKLAQET
jgi:hypothetical protein